MIQQIYCEVAFAIPTKNTYTYILPSNLITNSNYNNIIGRRVLVPFGNQKEKVGIITAIKEKNETQIQVKPIISFLDTNPIFNITQISIAEKISKKYLCSIGEILYYFFPFENKFQFNPAILQNINCKSNYKIPQNIKNILQKKEKILLIQPNSILEKFELYRNIIYSTLNQNKKCIFVFPQNSYLKDFYNYITSLSPYKEIFIYSGENEVSERFKIWTLVANNIAKVVLSTRIGIFLPYDEDTILVVDEPDSSGHKNLSNPLISTLEVISYLKVEKIFLVSFLFSTTTRLENKKINQISKLKFEREISFVEQKNKILFLLKKEVYKLKQTIVIYPKKGYLQTVYCIKCGTFFKCPKCSSHLQYHFQKKVFICTTCNYIEKKFLCPECNNERYKIISSGIQKMLEYLNHYLPEAKILKLDNDTPIEEKDNIISNFNEQKVDILISTQEILNFIYRINFSNTSLVYFATLDTIIFHPNYLSYENCYHLIYLFNLLTNKNCKFYLELYKKDDNYKSLLMDPNKFFINELKIRKELCYPPFCKLIQITLNIPKKNLLNETIKNIQNDLSELENISVFSTGEIKQYGENNKTSILIKILDSKEKLNLTQSQIMEIIEKYKTKDFKIYIDYDPKEFL